MDQTAEHTETGLPGVEALETDQPPTTREQIIESAAERFQKYGYGKTNVAEIAADCCMSPGNLYRYFRNKADIAEAIMRRA
ncbi:MAG: helix-turn-helix domain-containing protein, partial [Alphaproteobacteria bacterium]|nr:helix-turn-helix domain-containing protein [Alphaproteobacteria bacterium]